ncbi:MAG: SusC/RagA family TonB-linked outer membrane protein, partial [Prevotellaceae bacterium]|nr:SusC/RagA family TonB-linked outer membrane protein [Prevotellaceae bacterium]
MKKTNVIYRFMDLRICRFVFVGVVLSLSLLPAMAQDEVEDESSDTKISAPVRKQAKDTNPLMTISGVVVDQVTKSPVVGAHIQALNDRRYVAMTDAEGKFSIKVPTFTTSLFVDAPLFANQQVAIATNNEKQSIKVQMLSDAYKTMYVDGTDYTAKKSFNVRGGGLTIDDEVSGNLGADVRTIIRSGAPAGGASMFIRGLNSITSNSQPLVVIDGVEYDMQLNRSSLHDGQFFNMLANMSPEDIDKVTVLKNATALYGARGANGVILIETKRGHSMATRIDANISAGFTMIPKLPTMMNAEQYRTYATELLGTTPDMMLKENKDVKFNFLNDDPTNYYYRMYHNDTDWSKEAYRNAFTQNYNINVQGGDDIGMYNLSVGYLMAQSSAKENDFDRLNVRFNTDIKILWNLTTKFDMSFSKTDNNIFDDGIPSDLNAGAITSPTFLALIKSPLLSPYQYNHNISGFSDLLSDYDDLFSQMGDGYSLANPTAILANASGDNKNKAENTYFNVHLEPTYTFNDNLKLTTLFSYVLNRNSQRYYRPFNGVPPYEIANLGTVTSMAASLFSKETSVLSNTHLDWAKKLGKHDIAATAGFRYEYFSFDDSDLSTQYTSTTNDKNPALSASAGYNGIAGENDVWKNIQMYVNGDYNYMNRYFATLSLLAEANSRFGENANGLSLAGVKWAIFPSVQLGWVLTNENWFPKNSFVDYLRLNAGFDISGNDNISNYAARTSFTAVRYNYNVIGMQLTNIGNDKIQWENTVKWNIGLQSYLFNNRLGVNADFFIHKTDNLLTLKTFKNPIGGINNYWSNGGSLKNIGFEVGINGKPLSSKNLQLELGATIGHYKNEVTKLPDGSFTSSVYGDNNILTQVGSPVGVFYGYQTAGVFSTDDEAKSAGNGGYLYFNDAAAIKQYFKAGDVHFVDQNGDGAIDEADKVIIGDPNPDLYGNIYAMLKWKRFILNIGFNYSLGNDVFNYQRSVLNSGSTFYNQQIAEVGHWHYDGQVTDLPRLSYGDAMGNNRFSDRW